MDPLQPIQVCVHCGWTLAEFQARRLLGCPHCYASLGDALLGELLLQHPDIMTAPWALPTPEAIGMEGDPDTLAKWREQIGDALRREDYSEAARLKALIRQHEKKHGA